MRIHRERGDLEDLKEQAAPVEISGTTGWHDTVLSLKENKVSKEEAEASDADNNKDLSPWLYETDSILDDETAKRSDRTLAMNSSIRGLHPPRPMPTWTS